MYITKDPHIQNFRSIGLLGTELLIPPSRQDVWKTEIGNPTFISRLPVFK